MSSIREWRRIVTTMQAIEGDLLLADLAEIEAVLPPCEASDHAEPVAEHGATVAHADNDRTRTVLVCERHMRMLAQGRARCACGCDTHLRLVGSWRL